MLVSWHGNSKDNVYSDLKIRSFSNLKEKARKNDQLKNFGVLTHQELEEGNEWKS